VQIFIVEGAIIGLISWAISAILALPLGKILTSAIGEALVGWELDYTFSLPGVGIWLAAAILLSIAASYFPARRAAALTVREVLSYEG
jgi:ABC-type lipoprotein release transport system permease subunit